MNRRNIVQNLRVSGRLNGKKPAVVFLKKQEGGIYNKGVAYFVMAERNGMLNFQRLSTFRKNLVPEEDFSIELKQFNRYFFVKRSFYNILCLYNDKKRQYIEINYDKGTPDTYPTEENVAFLIDMLEKMGVKEAKLDNEK